MKYPDIITPKNRNGWLISYCLVKTRGGLLRGSFTFSSAPFFDNPAIFMHDIIDWFCFIIFSHAICNLCFLPFQPTILISFHFPYHALIPFLLFHASPYTPQTLLHHIHTPAQIPKLLLVYRWQAHILVQWLCLQFSAF